MKIGICSDLHLEFGDVNIKNTADGIKVINELNKRGYKNRSEAQLTVALAKYKGNTLIYTYADNIYYDTTTHFKNEKIITIKWKHNKLK